jgi:hypothetical protein
MWAAGAARSAELLEKRLVTASIISHHKKFMLLK